MSYQVAERGSIQILKIENLLNEFENRAILNDLDQKIQAGFHNFVLDLSKIDFMNSIGINFLLLAFKKTRDSNSKMALAAVPASVEKLLQVTKLNTVFSVAPSINDAIDSFKKK